MQNNFNFLPPEEYNVTAPEAKGQNENAGFGDNFEGQEALPQKEENNNEQKSSKKYSGSSSLVKTLLATTVAAVSIGTATVLTPSVDAKAEFLEVWANNNQVGYFLELQDWKQADLSVVLYNDFTNRVEEIDELDVEEYIDEEKNVTFGTLGGTIDFVQRGMQYTLSIVQGEGLAKKTLDSVSIKTTNEPVVLAQAQIRELWSDNVSVGYFLEATNYLDADLFVEVTAGEQVVQHQLIYYGDEGENLEVAGFEGNIEGLQRGTEYTFEIVQYDGCERHSLAQRTISTTNVTATINVLELWATNTEIGYALEIPTGYYQELYALAYNGDTKVEEALFVTYEEDEFQQTVGRVNDLLEGLQRNTSYTFEIVQVDGEERRTLLSRQITTANEPVTEWYGVSDRMGDDGYFYFTMDFVDETGEYYENPNNYFIATLTDGEGNVNNCLFSDDLHGEQKIAVSVQDPMTDSVVLVGDVATLQIVFVEVVEGQEIEHTLITLELYINNI